MFENKNKLPKLDRYLIFVTIKIICKLSTHSGWKKPSDVYIDRHKEVRL